MFPLKVFAWQILRVAKNRLRIIVPKSQKLVLLAVACLLVMSAVMSQPLIASKASGAPNLSAKTPKPQPGAGSVYDLIAMVNQLRASNGLAPFQANGALMAAAQAHSQYQASIGSTSHTGSGGSSVKSRALAAGFGGGSDVSVIENIYGGMGASPQNAVSWWQGDGPHLNTLLSTRHTEVGAGMAESGGVVYYTLDVGSVLGGSAPPADPPSQVPSGSSPAAPQSNAPTGLAFNPVVIATAKPDGSLVHLVQLGQTLWTIAAAYRVALPDLLQINGFSENSLIFPGDQILVRSANKNIAPVTPIPTQATQTEQPPPVDLPTEQKTSLPSSVLMLTGTQTQTITQIPVPVKTPAPLKTETAADIIWIFISVLLLGGLVLFAVGKWMDGKA